MANDQRFNEETDVMEASARTGNTKPEVKKAVRPVPDYISAFVGRQKGIPFPIDTNYDVEKAASLIGHFNWQSNHPPTPEMLIDQHLSSALHRFMLHQRSQKDQTCNIYPIATPFGDHSAFERILDIEIAQPTRNAWFVPLSTVAFLDVLSRGLLKEVASRRSSVLCSHDALNLNSELTKKSNLFYEKSIFGQRPKLHAMLPPTVYLPKFVKAKKSNILVVSPF